MKIIILTIILMSAFFSIEKLRNAEDAGSAKRALTQNGPGQSHEVYKSEKHGYQISVPSGFEVSVETEELVSIENFDSRLRVNAGCHEFGLENLSPSEEPIYLNGIPALKEDFYDKERLRIRRITLTGRGNRCISLEEIAETEEGWQELLQIRKTFQITS